LCPAIGYPQPEIHVWLLNISIQLMILNF
jgi:hypothetical protein